MDLSIAFLQVPIFLFEGEELYQFILAFWLFFQEGSQGLDTVRINIINT